MSVLIKGMEMPKSCWRCPLCLTVDPDTYRCMPTGQEFESTFDAIDHIVLPCPLTEIPPHGRLIDAEELRKQMYHEAFETDSDMQKWDSGCWIRYKMFERAEESAPTIIEAERG